MIITVETFTKEFFKKAIISHHKLDDEKDLLRVIALRLNCSEEEVRIFLRNVINEKSSYKSWNDITKDINLNR